ncbi:MAG: glycosyltransferase, partial [Patescibacteria group bacterium]|nr:glycosyltransferase [Patescibacteria group bacterium]
MNQKINYIIIIPIFNESDVIERSLKILTDFLEKKWINKNINWKVVVADNASTDNARQTLEKIKKENESHVDYLFVPIKGRGNAL